MRPKGLLGICRGELFQYRAGKMDCVARRRSPKHRMMLAPIVILITLPVLILLFSRRGMRPAREQAVPAPAE